MNSRGGLITLIVLLGVLLAWVILRPSPTPAPESIPGTGTAVSPTAESVPKLSLDLPKEPHPRGAARTENDAVEPEPTSPPLEATLEFVEEREALHRQLASANDPIFADVTRLMNAANLTKPSQLAAAWVLAQRWGVFIRGEGADLSKVEDPKMREELVEARRRILIDESANDLRRVAGEAVDVKLLAAIEEIGRRHAPAKIAMPRIVSPKSSRPPRPNLPPETHEEP
ncbi:MAG: hypothetical protein JNK85_04720 [Verrucomicrobiales bacterium]|nr:hypothetical protein [Verrucomicrobiales bacterium]